MILGLRTAIYHVSDLAKAKAWYRDAFGVIPYFDAPYYVGFNVGGFELGLNPDTKTIAPGARGVVAYWGVVDVNGTVDRLTGLGGTVLEPARDVGDGIIVATVADPFGNPIGLIHNPHYKA